jgi:hypothetical protein
MSNPLKFTLRDLFWLVLVVGMGCAWWLDRAHSDRELARLRQELQLLKLNAFDSLDIPIPAALR